MTKRTAKVIRLDYNAKKGVDKVERLDKLMIPFSSIEKIKNVLTKYLNKQIPHTIIRPYLYLLIPLALGIIGLGIGLSDNIYRFILIPIGMILFIIILAVIIFKKRKRNEILRNTGKKVSKYSKGMISMGRYYSYQVLMCSNKIKCCATLTNLIFRIRSKYKEKVNDIEKQKLKDPSRFIPANPKREKSVLNTTAYNTMPENKITISTTSIGQSNVKSSSKYVPPIIPIKEN
jgi:hypothetical protein